MLERDAVQKLYDQEGVGVLLPDLVDVSDIRMIESRGRLRFPLETSQGLRILRDGVGQT
jgi:hypothetical protein